jgi:enoyl-CoA hydratase/carnithine racemase
MGHVHFDVRGQIAWITLDNPSKLNAVDKPMSKELAVAYREVATNNRIRVAVITGAGQRAFCTGGDMNTYVDGVVGVAGNGERTPLPKPTGIWKPFIAAIRGHCIAGGFGLALACDLRIASTDARIGPAGLKRGVIAGGEQTQRLIRLISFSTALEILLLSRYIDAEEAKSIGLVNRVVPSAEVLDLASEWAETLAAFSASALQTTKQIAYEGLDLTWAAALELEEEAQIKSFKTDDAQEGYRAFLEGRAPHFS